MPDEDATKIENEAMLDQSRKNMIDTLSLFFTHAKYTLTLMFTLLTAALAIAGFAIKEATAISSYIDVVLLADSIILIFLFPTALVSKKLVARYYKLYVSCYVYTVRLHDKFAAQKHPWLEEMKERVTDIYDDNSVKEFIEDRTFGEDHSWYYYQLLISAIGYFGAATGISLFFYQIYRITSA